jgi:hypothetical protein
MAQMSARVTGFPGPAIRREMVSSGISPAGIGAVAAACCLSFAARAAAEEAEPVHLTYDAPARCPSEAALLETISRDGGRLVQVPDEQPARSFLLHIAGTDPIVGRLLIRHRDGREAAREVDDIDCDVVMRALAVLVALSLKPVSTPPEPPAPENPTPSPPEPEVEGPLPAVPGLAAGPLPIEPGSSEYDDPRPSVRRPRGWRFDFSGEGTVSTGAAASLDPGFAAYLELLDEIPSFFAPSIRLGAEISAKQSFAAVDNVSRLVARLDACSFRAVASRPWSDDALTLEPCARIDVGRLDVKGWATGMELNAEQLWVAPAALLRLRWTSPGVFVELEGGALFPLTRNPFSGDGSSFAVPPIGATSGLGFGVYAM